MQSLLFLVDDDEVEAASTMASRGRRKRVGLLASFYSLNGPQCDLGGEKARLQGYCCSRASILSMVVHERDDVSSASSLLTSYTGFLGP